MERYALIVAFFVAGISYSFAALYSFGFPRSIPYPHLFFFLPVVIMGAFAWIKRPFIARSSPIVLVILLAFAGILWTDRSEQGRAMLIFAYIAIVPAIAALINKKNLAYLCESVFIISSVVGLLIALVLYNTGYGVYAGRLELADETGTGVTNANQLGAQLALASMFALSRFLRTSSLENLSLKMRISKNIIGVIALPFLVTGLLLTASRGATVTLAMGFGALLLIWSLKAANKKKRKTGILIAVLVLLGASGFFVSDLRQTQEGSLESIQDRFSNETVSTLGDRMPIWRSGYDALTYDARHLIIGAGTGGADKWLGRFAPMTRPAHDGIMRKSSHNAIVEWILSFGLIGVAVGSLLFVFLFRRAYIKVKVGNNSLFIAFWVFALFHGMTLVSYRQPSWPVMGSLLLLSLTSRYMGEDT